MNAPSSAGPSLAPTQGVRLTVLYDSSCAFCQRCKDWLAMQPCLVEVELLGSRSPLARERYGSVPWLGSELVVVSDKGEVWIGPDAFIACMWATARYRGWAYLFMRPAFSRFAERFFVKVSKDRDKWSQWLSRKDDGCSYCDDVRLGLKLT